MKDNECKVIKISKKALFEFIYESFIDKQEIYLNTNDEYIQTSFYMDYEENSFISIGYKLYDGKGNVIHLPKEIDIKKLIRNMEDTTATMYADGRYKKMTFDELISIQEKGYIKCEKDITIRECNPDDYEAIYRLNRDEMGYDYPLEKTRAKLENLLNDAENKIYVAVADNKVVGYVHANSYESIYLDSLKNIMGIAVDSEYKRRGIGKMLLCAVEDWAKKSCASGVRLVSGGTRKDAHKFYQACGYGDGKEQLNFKKKW